MALIDRAAGWYARGSALRRRMLGAGERVPGVTVISVGALRAGGVGKSVVAPAVADALAGDGVSTAVVLRGYGGTTAGPYRVLPSDTATAVGDEAVEHVRRAAGDWAVVVSRQRVAGTTLARDLGCTAVVLDDGFQHRAIARDLDLVLVTAGDLHAGVWPAGPLRESLDALAHAGKLLTTDVAPLSLLAGRPVHRCAVTLAGYESPTGDTENPAHWRGARALLVTAIARPERVAALAAEAGVRVVEHRQYPDHGPLPPEAFGVAAGHRFDVLLVTGKDAARGALAMGDHGLPRRTLRVRAVLPDDIRDAVVRAAGRTRRRDDVQGKGVVRVD